MVCAGLYSTRLVSSRFDLAPLTFTVILLDEHAGTLMGITKAEAQREVLDILTVPLPACLQSHACSACTEQRGHAGPHETTGLARVGMGYH